MSYFTRKYYSPASSNLPVRSCREYAYSREDVVTRATGRDHLTQLHTPSYTVRLLQMNSSLEKPATEDLHTPAHDVHDGLNVEGVIEL